MSDAIETVATLDDEREVNVFRDSLRDGNIRARLHGARGEPASGGLKLLEDKVTLVWQPTALPLQHLLPPSLLARLTMDSASVLLTDVKTVRTGRQTTNFVRTIKYLTTDELPASDDKCLSLCFLGQTSPAVPPQSPSPAESPPPPEASPPAAAGSTEVQVETFDVEFEDEQTRDIARAFFRQQAGIDVRSGSEDTETFSDIQLPSGLPTRCYQVVAHPSFQLAVLIAVVGSMTSVGWRSFRYISNSKDDDDVEEVARFGMTVLEYLLLVFLTVEQICKGVGLEGLLPLLRSKWDAFDLCAVMISWLAVLPFSSLAGFNLLSLRVFRGMRIFKRWKSFQETMETFLVSLPMAGNAVLCYCYYLFLFAILGMYLFNDSLSHRCAIQADSDSFIAPMSVGETKTYVPETPVHFCRIDDKMSGCRSNMECVAMPPPDRGYTGFHSFQASFLTVFLITLRSGFGPSLDGAQQASSYFSIIYFIGLIVFVSYMILSLFVGIVRGSYITVSIVRAAKLAEQEKRMDKYLKKPRLQFPKGTEAFPDVMQVLDAKWQVYRARFKEWLLGSPLFTRSDGTFLSWCRLRQERIFFLLEPGSQVMDRISSIAESLAFEHIMNLVVFFNSVLFALEYHGMSDSYAARLYMIENFLMLVYGTEFVIIAAAAGGLIGYLQNPWNRLDFVLLVIACVEFLLLTCSVLLYSDSYARGIFVLRLFRLVRPFRVVRQNNKLLLVLDAILASVPAFLSSIAFHVLLNSVFAVVGMNLFGGNFPLTMQSHFNTFSDSMLTLFKFSNGGSVWPIFHASLQASSFGVALLYYLTYVVLCRFLALNFMLVVLLRNFAMKGDERRKTLSELFQDRMFAMQRIHLFDMYTFVEEFSNLYQGDVMNVSLPGSAKKRAQRALSASEAFKARLFNVLPTSDFLKLKGYYGTTRNQQDRKYIQLEGPAPAHGKHKNQATVTPIDDSVSSAAAAAIVPVSGLESPADTSGPDEWTGWTSTGGTTGYVRQFFDGHWLMADVSLFLFPPQSWVRLKARRLEKETEKYIFAAIVIRTVMLTVQSPLYSSLIQELTTLSDVVYAIVLFFEFALKVISRGFFFTPKSYLSNTWNQINMVVLMACSLLLLLPHSTMISLFRLGRAFGPIRVFYRVRTFRVITEALKQSARPIFYCVVLSVFLFYSFATLGMQIFGGRFAYCSDPSVDTPEKCVGVFWNSATGILTPRVWGNLSGLHFDNITGAMSSILFLISMKGWLPVVNIAMDFVDDMDANSEHQASAIASTYFAGFFVAFLFFTRFYLLKVFAGILMNNFRCYNGTLLLTNLQLIWLRKKQAIVAMRPKYPLPTSRFMQLAQVYMQKRSFRGFISTVVILHTSLLAWYRSPIHRANTDGNVDVSAGVWWFHYIFSLIYALDAVLRVAAVGWRDFLMKGFTWRTFNSCTAFIMLVGPLLSDSPVLLVLGMTRAFDFKHLSLVLERSRALRTLFRTLLASVQLTLKVTLLLGYVLFVFAIVGVQVFSLTRWASGLNGNLNLTTFPMAYAAFVKFAAGEDWYATYLASSVEPPQCVLSGRSSTSASYASDCGSPVISGLFYNFFYVLVVLILQNLYAATMVDTYVLMSARTNDNEQLLGFQAEHLQRFQTIWSDFDTDALGLVRRKHLLTLLTRLEPPLGLGTHKAMLDSLATEDTTPEEWTALSNAVHQRRRETFHDIEARIAELAYRVRLGLGSYDGLNGSVSVSANPDLVCPPNMIRFTDLLLVLTMRVLPLESLTVQEKVDELAMRGYSFRHRKAIIIQSAFRMFRVRRRTTSRIRKAKRSIEIKRQQSDVAVNATSTAQPEEKTQPTEGEPPSQKTVTSLALAIAPPTLALPASICVPNATSERLRAPASVAPILSEHLELQPEASDARKCSI
ncbi:Dihydropyridine-sensitive L-type skeletal muscle calcium channel subunit alpha-1 [Phytophthora ramorum]|uniref:Dihydropyridine-sensitive L-type skeletal muscle calcium channel subunit alpha-1 n=1 Tax=Phytophthora ramorum TaxID=164328 RepID=UPI0030B570E9|nr:Dihydropyridine-sensitive L-type skeletal muscle calcium channel subunit alpha-1 [Phytophthora ramorum]